MTEPTDVELAEKLLACFPERHPDLKGPIQVDADLVRLAASRLRSDPPVDGQGGGASSGDDRASRATPQAAARLDQKATIPCADCAGGVWPMYGVAPHECYWRKGPAFMIGQSTLLPIGPDDCFVPDLKEGETWADFQYPSACGTFYCPHCQPEEYRHAWDALIERIGPPPASAIETRQGHDPEEGYGAEHESAVRSRRPDDPTTVRARALEEAACLADKAYSGSPHLHLRSVGKCIASAIRALGKDPS